MLQTLFSPQGSQPSSLNLILGLLLEVQGLIEQRDGSGTCLQRAKMLEKS
jgi:hypothetical protein